MSNVIFMLMALVSCRCCVGHSVWRRATCDKPVDVILALDASGSVLKENWVKEVEFAQKFASEILSEKSSLSRVGIIDFSMIANEDVPLTSEADKLLQGLELMKERYQNGLTHTQLALTRAKEMFASTMVTGDETKILVIVTDGKTSVEQGQVGKDVIREPTQSLKDSGVKIIAVAVQQQHNIAEEVELKVLASEPYQQNVFHLNNYTELLSRLEAIIQAACPSPTVAPTTPSTIAPTDPTTVAPTTPTTPDVGCDVKYVKVGCYTDNQIPPRPLPEMLFTDRDSSVALYSNVPLVWAEWDTYLPGLACRCAQSAKKKQYSHFGLQYYGECWSGPEGGTTYAQNGEEASAKCKTIKFEPCENSNDLPCAGDENMNYVYEIVAEER